tara:strand:- start:526 stop:828 length:303 start_codon:yes stop_codon:yes gene_type:complete
MAFKMKGSPMQRNFGTGTSPLHSELSQAYYDETGTHVGTVDLGNIENKELRLEESRRRRQQSQNIIKQNPDNWHKVDGIWTHKETNQTMKDYVNSSGRKK